MDQSISIVLLYVTAQSIVEDATRIRDRLNAKLFTITSVNPLEVEFDVFLENLGCKLLSSNATARYFFSVKRLCLVFY